MFYKDPLSGHGLLTKNTILVFKIESQVFDILFCISSFFYISDQLISTLQTICIPS